MIYKGPIVPLQNEIEYCNDAADLKINSGAWSRGVFYMTQNELMWKSQASEEGFKIDWADIVVQAISTEPERSIYFMIDSVWEDAEQPRQHTNGNSNTIEEDPENEECEEGSESEVTEFWLKTDNPDSIDQIYYIMTRLPRHETENIEEEEEGSEEESDINMDQMNISDRFADAD